LEEFLAKYDGCDLTDPFNVQELEKGACNEEMV